MSRIGDHPKSIKKALHQLEDLAYERELHRELGKLDESFAEWRGGQIDSWELNDRIHKFHNGDSREIWKKYSYGAVEANIAWAIREGLVRREEVSTDVLDAIKNWLSFYETPQLDSGDKEVSET